MDALRLTSILLVIATIPLAAAADGDSPPAVPSPASSPPAVTPDAPDRATMQSMELRIHAQMETVLGQMRASQLELRRDLLGVLTPQQRALVATTIGELAVSTQWDDAAAAARIDAALTPAQRQAVLQILSTNATRREAEFQNVIRQNQQLPEQLPALAQRAPSQPVPQQIETHAFAEPIAAGVGALYGPYGAAGQTSAGGAVLSVPEMPIPQLFTPPVLMVQPH